MRDCRGADVTYSTTYPRWTLYVVTQAGIDVIALGLLICTMIRDGKAAKTGILSRLL